MAFIIHFNCIYYQTFTFRNKLLCQIKLLPYVTDLLLCQNMLPCQKFITMSYVSLVSNKQRSAMNIQQNMCDVQLSHNSQSYILI